MVSFVIEEKEGGKGQKGHKAKQAKQTNKRNCTEMSQLINHTQKQQNGMVRDINPYRIKGNYHTSNSIYKNHISTLYSKLPAIMHGVITKKPMDRDGMKEDRNGQLWLQMMHFLSERLICNFEFCKGV